MREFGRFLLWTLLVLGVLSGIARLVAVRPWTAPTSDPWLEASMMPTIFPGDKVLLWRLTPPSYGDLVLCPEPGAPERVVVGRILGMGGDKMDVLGAQVTINGASIRTERGCPAFQSIHPRSGAIVDQNCSEEDLQGSLHHRGNIADNYAAPPKFRSVVPEGKLFLVSDNRQFPFDSRDYGPVSAESCKETVIFRLWSRKGYMDHETRFEVLH